MITTTESAWPDGMGNARSPPSPGRREVGSDLGLLMQVQIPTLLRTRLHRGRNSSTSSAVSWSIPMKRFSTELAGISSSSFAWMAAPFTVLGVLNEKRTAHRTGQSFCLFAKATPVCSINRPSRPFSGSDPWPLLGLVGGASVHQPVTKAPPRCDGALVNRSTPLTLRGGVEEARTVATCRQMPTQSYSFQKKSRPG
jgi:hypothetical protein